MAGKLLQRTEKLDTLALNLYKHIQFAPKLIKEKVQDSNYTESTIHTYFMGMKHFVKTGKRNLKQAPNVFYDAIQEYIDKHVAQLTPKAEEKARVINRTYHSGPRKKQNIKVTKMDETERTVRSNTSSKLNISPETMQTIQNIGKVSGVGIKVGNGIKLFENEDMLNGYVQCLQDLSSKIEDLTYDVIEFSYKVKN